MRNGLLSNACLLFSDASRNIGGYQIIWNHAGDVHEAVITIRRMCVYDEETEEDVELEVSNQKMKSLHIVDNEAGCFSLYPVVELEVYLGERAVKGLKSSTINAAVSEVDGAHDALGMVEYELEISLGGAPLFENEDWEFFESEHAVLFDV